jgi:Ser/Thr protein kinase RdoA (MazF antagonist)
MESDNRLRKIYDAFSASGKFVSATPLAGEEGDAYHVIADEEAEYLLHRVRAGAFANIPAMIHNKEMVSGHIRNKLIQQNVHDITRKYLTHFRTYRQQPYYKDHEGDYWTLALFIKGSKIHERVPSPAIAREIGVALGEFARRTRDFDPRLLEESVPAYQHVTRWQERLKEALAKAGEERQEACGECLERLRPFDATTRAWQEALDERQFPARVTHNAFRAGSVLFDWNDQPLCVVGLDMVMPGMIHHDFGDATRSVCNPGEGRFDMTLFREFTAGFMSRAGRLLSRGERETLAFACELMPYLQATRRLVEFLLKGTAAVLQQAKEEVSFLRAIAEARDATRECLAPR